MRRSPYNGHRIATVIFFLNDVEEGGETYFPLQREKIKPVQGRVVIFPPDYMHPHEVLAPKTKRYISCRPGSQIVRWLFVENTKKRPF